MFDRSILELSDDDLSQSDLIRLNLSVGADLPYARDVDVERCLAQASRWTDLVQAATERMWTYRAKYADFTDNQFRVLVMATVLQRDLGVTYNLAFSEGLPK